MSEMLMRLQGVLAAIGPVAVAVSGGIDSLTLATAAHRVCDATMHHATSPAVPAEASERTRALAAIEGWSLDVFDAGEFDDPAYRANPVNRCFFCKTSLYGAVARRTERQILSGTNLDDLGDFRPGLAAARDHAVRHPFVEAGVDKRTVRALAVELGLGALSELPAAPCLSSRVETGIRIEAPVLALVHAAERLVSARLAPRTVRCRVRAGAVVIELDEAALARLDPGHDPGRDPGHAAGRDALQGELQAMADAAGLARPVSFAGYRTGSAFLRPPVATAS